MRRLPGSDAVSIRRPISAGQAEIAFVDEMLI